MVALFGAASDLGAMSQVARAAVKAILGPTNTGKTFLAVERMAAHSSGMMGFPLRLLAREVYDRVVAMKGAHQVALITGEEKIVPPQARWFLCTAESMPLERDFAFVGLDEGQLGADPERGHIFTDRMLHARGREETMILGSASLTPIIRALLPKAEITSRPRFSTLSYAGPAKLSRLPPRSAIVAFSAEQVYAVAEMLRRMRGGAAVVMGPLSPRTRNAQVAMYQAGEVDYLVATDAIGMGLNLDIGHVAFAGLTKFDGVRRRRLTIAEMAQIAGRAGRHQRDGTFGSLTLAGEAMPEFRDEEVLAIEEHRFAPLDFLYWRESELNFDGIEPLIASLERRPARRELRPAPEAIDLTVLKQLSGDPVTERARDQTLVRRLWAACGLPDFRKTGPEHHSRLVARIFGHLSEGAGHVPKDWFSSEVARLDNVQGDIDTLADRLAGIRTWAYVAHRADWLAEPEEMAARAKAVEEKLSDALHERLTQRFVDRRTAVLMRDLGRGASGDFPVVIDDEGEVSVGTYAIGRLNGFAFEVDPTARHADRKMLLATAERRLAGEYEKRAAALAADTDEHFALRTDAGAPPAILWRGHEIARFTQGKNLLSPRVALDRRLESVSQRGRDAVIARLKDWAGHQVERVLPSLRAAGHAAQDAAAPAPIRALLSLLVDEGGVLPRDMAAGALAALDRGQRRAIGRLGVRIGALDLFMPALLKPEPMRWRAALLAARAGEPMPAIPASADAVVAGKPPAQLGYRLAGAQAIRVDIAERMASRAHEAKAGRVTEPVDETLVTSLGLKPETVAKLMRDLGFQPAQSAAKWVWRGRRRPAPKQSGPKNSPFAALRELAGG